MPYIKRELSKPIYKEQTEEPKKVLFIACEGNITEPEYFKTIKNRLNFNQLIEIKVIDRDKNDTKSAPKYIMNNMKEYIELLGIELSKDADEAWIVIDRDSQNNPIKVLKEIILECKKNDYNLALTNPLFELWLLMHIEDITKYDKDILKKNEKVNSKKRFLDKELSNKLKAGYNKKRFNKNIVTKENIKFAIKQSENLETNLEKILYDVGTTLSLLLNKIIKNSH